MSVFNSLGSNYDSRFIFHSFGFGRKRDTANLKKLLHERYQAETIQLTYKGREAITLALKQLDLAEGSLVAVNGFTCYAVYQAITTAGLKPYYLDIEQGSLNFSPEILEQ
ncbi:MAG TPA: DegT/DnrJ/EryC1/StrS family aminotransferase, partial [Candidatus Saccharimonadales bacterium]|nr:DegT/DnrJ/EryC1/StrS family aminotransferase [Candidatus Saccharimonadales bacterium]